MVGIVTVTHHVGPPSAGPGYYGYSCQVWFVLEVAGERFGTASRWAWFSLGFNPLNNADSSNPCWLYTELSRAVQQNDVGSKLIKGYRATLLDMINKEENAGKLTSQDAVNYRSRITSAPVESFRPEVWRLDLRAISRRKYHHEDVDKAKKELQQRAQREVQPPQVAQGNEYLIDDLQSGEYEEVIIG